MFQIVFVIAVIAVIAGLQVSEPNAERGVPVFGFVCQVCFFPVFEIRCVLVHSVAEARYLWPVYESCIPRTVCTGLPRAVVCVNVAQVAFCSRL